MLKLKYWILKKILVLMSFYFFYTIGRGVMYKIINDPMYENCGGIIDMIKTEFKNKEHKTNYDAEEQPTDEIRIGFH